LDSQCGPSGSPCGSVNVVDSMAFFVGAGNGTNVCVDTMNYPGVDVTNNWFICPEAIHAWGNGLRILHNTCDNATGQCVVVTGNGASHDNPTHSVEIANNDFYAQNF